MYELFLQDQLTLNRCPHCSVSKPNIVVKTNFETNSFDKQDKKVWGVYVCTKCGGVITASAWSWGDVVDEIYPVIKSVDNSLPIKAKAFLQQANETIHSPSGSIMLSASCVDAMLKAKGYKEGSLYKRIEKAVEEHLITSEMAKWAHQVRLDANDERHADEDAELPTSNDAKKLIEFVTALAQFLFVLPAMIEEGIEKSKIE
jgi:DNA-directed RNA polymerase subunit RPC12/RpoP